MKVTATLAFGCLAAAHAFVTPAPHLQQRSAVRMGAASGDDEWRKIVGSEANLREYLGANGFRYNLNKTPQEVAKEGELTFFEKMFGSTSNNAARLAARAQARAITIDTYDQKKAVENKEWIAKYGYKRWGLSYLDKSAIDEEKTVSGSKAEVSQTNPPAKTPVAAGAAAPVKKVRDGNR